MSSANPWIGKNYIADNTRVDVPPAYFLQRIWDQDAMLVILPRRHVPGAYVIARRKQFGPGLTEKALDAQFTQPDTKMCILNGCVPVCLMYHTGVGWDPEPIIRSLQARDLWTHGGGDKVADMLDAQDEAEKAKTRQAIRDDLYNRSGDAYRSYQHRTGQSTIRSKDYRQPRTKAAASQSPSSTSGSTAGSGLGQPN